MTEEEKNTICIEPLFLLLSKKTGNAYLDKNCFCYLFQTKMAAEAFLENSTQELVIQDAKAFTLRDFWTIYNQGAKGVRVFFREEKKAPKDIPLKEEDAMTTCIQYYNNETNGNLNRLQQTSEKKFLTALSAGIFITPVNIVPRKEKGYPGLHYSYATFKDDQPYFLLFSTLQEYEKWSAAQDINWKPMEVTIKKFGRIRGKHPVLINPLSNKLILTHDLLKQACAQAQKKDSIGETHEEQNKNTLPAQ